MFVPTSINAGIILTAPADFLGGAAGLTGLVWAPLQILGFLLAFLPELAGITAALVILQFFALSS